MTDTKNQILDIAEELIQRVGLNAMSYQHISEAVGIRKASIHHHFPRKEHLVDTLLERCQRSYGAKYQSIVEGDGKAPDKLRQLAEVFEEGLGAGRLCLIGSLSSVSNTLQESSRKALETTIQNTTSIFSSVFTQGRQEGSLVLSGSDGDAAKALLSLLVGAQISCRAFGGVASFRETTKSMISNWER